MQPTKKLLDEAIEHGLAFISQAQCSNGSFQSFLSTSPKSFTNATACQTTFVPALMLASLAAVDTDTSNRIRSKLAPFLISQKSSHWSFNYWAVNAEQRQTRPYPDDLDDTFCVLSALALQKASLITEEITARAVKLLLLNEIRPGGPYRTWLVPTTSHKIWLDVDLAVNSNIAYFLSLVSSPIPQLTAYIDKAILAKKLISPYYPSAHQLAYYMARGYRGEQTAAFIKIIQDLLAEKGITPLQLSLSITALLRLGVTARLDSRIRKLLTYQQTNGSWAAEAFCIDSIKKDQSFYIGSPALTTAFVLETLQLYKNAQTPRLANSPSTTPEETTKAQRRILRTVKQDSLVLAKELRKPLQKIIQTLIQSKSSSEIMLLPHQFNQSLRKPLVKREAFLDTLGIANLYGWAAYTIYDDFLDNEGDPRLLSAGNVALRKSVQAFSQALPNDTNFALQVQDAFNVIDSANAWELAHCRCTITATHIRIKTAPNFNKLEKLAERSLGHTLTPLGILAATGVSTQSVAPRLLQKALEHYLIARQLNDDMHDWQADMENGRMTYVVSTILSEMHIKPGSYRFDVLLPRMQKHFWHKTLRTICKTMRYHTTESRNILKQIDALRPANVITKLLDTIEGSIATTLIAQKQAKKFLHHYRQDSLKKKS